MSELAPIVNGDSLLCVGVRKGEDYTVGHSYLVVDITDNEVGLSAWPYKVTCDVTGASSDIDLTYCFLTENEVYGRADVNESDVVAVFIPVKYIQNPIQEVLFIYNMTGQYP